MAAAVRPRTAANGSFAIPGRHSRSSRDLYPFFGEFSVEIQIKTMPRLETLVESGKNGDKAALEKLIRSICSWLGKQRELGADFPSGNRIFSWHSAKGVRSPVDA
jgi:hypothetical protein